MLHQDKFDKVDNASLFPIDMWLLDILSKTSSQKKRNGVTDPLLFLILQSKFISYRSLTNFLISDMTYDKLPNLYTESVFYVDRNFH